MADALASGASVLRDVGVQVPLRPQCAVLRTAGIKVTNSIGFVTFVFGAATDTRPTWPNTSNAQTSRERPLTTHWRHSRSIRVCRLVPLHMTRRQVLTSMLVNIQDRSAMKIGELASASGLSIRTVRYYDQIGLLTPSGRTGAGHRLYDETDVRRLYRICLLRRTGLALSEISRALDETSWQLHRPLPAHLEMLDH